MIPTKNQLYQENKTLVELIMYSRIKALFASKCRWSKSFNCFLFPDKSVIKSILIIRRLRLIISSIHLYNDFDIFDLKLWTKILSSGYKLVLLSERHYSRYDIHILNLEAMAFLYLSNSELNKKKVTFQFISKFMYNY